MPRRVVHHGQPDGGRHCRDRAAGVRIKTSRCGTDRSIASMTLPLIILIVTLVAYPGGLCGLSWRCSTRAMTRFVGLGNFEFLFGREDLLDGSGLPVVPVHSSPPWFFKVVIGFGIAHFVLRRSDQRTAQMARHAAGAFGHSARHEHARLALAVRPVLLGHQLDPRARGPRSHLRGWAKPAGRASP